MKLPNAIGPLSVATRLVGLNPISRWSKVYVILIFTCKLFLISKAWHYELGQCYENFWFTVFVYFIHDAWRVSSDSIIVVTTLLDPKRYMIPLKDLEIIDGTLENLGLRVDDTGPYRLQLLHLVFFGVVSFLMSLWHAYSILLIKNRSDFAVIAATGSLSALMIIYNFAVVDCSFCTVLSIIRERFKLINMTIRRAKNRPMTNFEVTEISSGVTEDIVLRELKILREQYHELWDISNRHSAVTFWYFCIRKVNQAYGLHLLVAAAASLAIVTVCLWQVYLRIKPGIYPMEAIGSELAWAVLYIIRLFFLAQACEFTLAEAQVTGIVLQELLMKDEWRSATKSEIRDFLMQHQLEVQEFTACKFFEVNSTMVHGILSTATVFLVILIQMGEDDDP